MSRFMSRLPRWPAVVLAALALFLSVSVVHAREMVSTVRDGVEMRTGPGPRYKAKWALDKGYPLVVLSRKGAWVQVRDFENDRGWVLGARTGRAAHHVSKANGLNLRATPSPRARVVGKAGYGDILRTLERRGDWVKVRHTGSGATGWVSKGLIWGW